MTETTHVSASTREVPLAPGGEVHVLLTANNAIVRGTDRDIVTVRARGGEDLDDEVVITEDGNRVSIRNAETGVQARAAPDQHPRTGRARDRGAAVRDAHLQDAVRRRGRRGRWAGTAAGRRRRATSGSSWAAGP